MRATNRSRLRRLIPVLVVVGAVFIAVGEALSWLPMATIGGLLVAVGGGWLGAIAVAWTWRRVVYRVGIRLFISYVLVGVAPLVVLALMSGLAVYMLVGQYASARLAEAMRFVGRELDHLASRAMEGDMPAAMVRLGEAAIDPPESGAGLEWFVAEGGQVLRSPGFQAGPPSWPDSGAWSGPVRLGGELWLASLRRSGDRTVGVLMPLNVPTARALSEGRFYDARFTIGSEFSAAGAAGAPAGETGVTFRVGGDTGAVAPEVTGTVIRVEGGGPGAGAVEPGWLASGFGRGGVLSGRWVVWFRVGRAVRDWSTGEELQSARVMTLLKTSIRGAVADLVADPAGTGDELLNVLVGLGGTFLVLYALAAAMAAVMVVTVTRSTARLSRGARAVAHGDLAYRIPVRRRDQLGDLAASFNEMSESVERMLVQVAEKERLSRELELAREIQRSLLPPREVVHGRVAVECHFSPAAEVGGDYFDVFALADEEVVVAVGDVAGHGISTGLLMAMVKSAVATLIGEGYRGIDLLERLNRLLSPSEGGRRMVTLVVAEINPKRGCLRLTSAGHPPALLLSDDGSGGLEEVVLESLPLGFRWPDPPASRTCPFPAGRRLLLYSDGVVEAADGAGEPFGYERLAASVASRQSSTSSTIVAGVVDDVRDHLAASVLQNDDVTVLVVEHLRDDARPAGQGSEE